MARSCLKRSGYLQRAVSRPNCEAALKRIGAELQVLLDRCPDLWGADHQHVINENTVVEVLDGLNAVRRLYDLPQKKSLVESTE